MFFSHVLIYGAGFHQPFFELIKEKTFSNGLMCETLEEIYCFEPENLSATFQM